MQADDPFRERFLRRMAALAGRPVETIPAELLPPNPRSAAVLMPFWPGRDGRIETVFTERPAHMPSHAGQVSFPGGKQDAGDASIVDTALREAREEIGIEPDSVRIMGRLDDAWSFAGHHVVAVVGWLEAPPLLRPDPREVARVIVADLETVLRPEAACEHRAEYNGRMRTSQAFRWDGGYVWGLTADFLLELQLWLEERPSNRARARIERLQSLLRG